MAAGRNISYVKPSEPSFIRRMKEQVGFKEGPTVDTKREQLPKDDGGGGGDKKDDEAPQVVVLRPGDLTREEADKLLDRLDADDSPDESPCHGQEYATVENQEVEISDSEEASTAVLQGKIAFRKPTKRQSSTADGDDGGVKDDDQKQAQEELFGLNASSNSKRCRKDSRARKNSSSEMQQVNNRSLLSFDDDEHDDDDG